MPKGIMAMMENPKDHNSKRSADVLFDQVLEGIRSCGRGDEPMGSHAVMSALDIHHKIYYLLGNVLKASTRAADSERPQPLRN